MQLLMELLSTELKAVFTVQTKSAAIAPTLYWVIYMCFDVDSLIPASRHDPHWFQDRSHHFFDQRGSDIVQDLFSDFPQIILGPANVSVHRGRVWAFNELHLRWTTRHSVIPEENQGRNLLLDAGINIVCVKLHTNWCRLLCSRT